MWMREAAEEGPVAMALTDDGRVFAVVGGEQLALVEAATGAVMARATVPRHEGAQLAFVVSPRLELIAIFDGVAGVAAASSVAYSFALAPDVARAAESSAPSRFGDAGERSTALAPLATEPRARAPGKLVVEGPRDLGTRVRLLCATAEGVVLGTAPDRGLLLTRRLVPVPLGGRGPVALRFNTAAYSARADRLLLPTSQPGVLGAFDATPHKPVGMYRVGGDVAQMGFGSRGRDLWVVDAGGSIIRALRLSDGAPMWEVTLPWPIARVTGHAHSRLLLVESASPTPETAMVEVQGNQARLAVPRLAEGFDGRLVAGAEGTFYALRPDGAIRKGTLVAGAEVRAEALDVPWLEGGAARQLHPPAQQPDLRTPRRTPPQLGGAVDAAPRLLPARQDEPSIASDVSTPSIASGVSAASIASGVSTASIASGVSTASGASGVSTVEEVAGLDGEVPWTEDDDTWVEPSDAWLEGVDDEREAAGPRAEPVAREPATGGGAPATPSGPEETDEDAEAEEVQAAQEPADGDAWMFDLADEEDEAPAPAPPPSATPPIDPADALHQLRRRGLDIVEAALDRRGQSIRPPGAAWLAGEGAGDGPPSLDEVSRLLSRRRLDHRASIDEPPAIGRVDHSPFSPSGRLRALVETARLGPTEIDALALLVLLASDADVRRALPSVCGHASPTAALMFEMVYWPREGTAASARRCWEEEMRPSGTLFRLGWLRREDDGVLLVHRGLLDALGGVVELPVQLEPFCRLYLPDDGDGWGSGHAAARGAEGGPGVDAEDAESLGAARATRAASPLLDAVQARGYTVLLVGSRWAGGKLIVRRVGALVDRPVVLTRAQSLTSERMRAAREHASFLGAILVVEEADALFAARDPEPVLEQLWATPGAVVLLCENTPKEDLLGDRPVLRVALDVPPLRHRREAWRKRLGITEDAGPLDEAPRPTDGAAAEGGDRPGWPAEWLDLVASRYYVGIGGIVAIAREARQLARMEHVPVEPRHVAEAASRVFAGDLSQLATKIQVKQSWSDLVVPASLQSRIDELAARVRYHSSVFTDWGFEKKLGRGLGLLVLLHGPPGTGKTMTAGLVAKSLGLDLYLVDLSQVTSKWLGESEKNLKRLFDAAETGHVLLLFDEADSVLGKRSVGGGGSAQDRYANLGTNYLLARLESFRGTAFFTTNHASSIDPAIHRRLSLRLEFPFPTAAERALLWERIVPGVAAVGSDVDFEDLGQRFELSGGIIRNAALRAAFLARSESVGVGMRHLVEAVKREYEDRGRIVTDGAGQRLE